MRQITSHKVAGNEHNEVMILVTDEPGAGGANHKYEIWPPLNVAARSFQEASAAIAEINFQNGPIPVNGITGVTHEVLLAIVADRLECFQAGPFPCHENEIALLHVNRALELLKNRTEDRIKRAVEGQLKA